MYDVFFIRSSTSGLTVPVGGEQGKPHKLQDGGVRAVAGVSTDGNESK